MQLWEWILNWRKKANNIFQNVSSDRAEGWWLSWFLIGHFGLDTQRPKSKPEPVTWPQERFVCESLFKEPGCPGSRKPPTVTSSSLGRKEEWMVLSLPDSLSPANSDSKDAWTGCSHWGPLSSHIVLSLVSHHEGVNFPRASSGNWIVSLEATELSKGFSSPTYFVLHFCLYLPCQSLT